MPSSKTNRAVRMKGQTKVMSFWCWTEINLVIEDYKLAKAMLGVAKPSQGNPHLIKRVISLQMLTRQCDAKTEVWTKDVEWIWMQVRIAVVTLPMSPIMIKLKTTFSECWGLRADPQQGCGRTLSIFIRMLPWTKIWQETMPPAIRLQFKRGFQRTKILTLSNLKIFFVTN